MKQQQLKDLYEDILDLKNTALIENMKQKNLINIEQHCKEYQDQLNQKKGTGKAGSKRS